MKKDYDSTRIYRNTHKKRVDRFGKNVILFPTDDEHFTVNVNVHVSRQFLGWLFSLGDGIKIVGPDDVVEQMRSEIKRLIEHYS